MIGADDRMLIEYREQIRVDFNKNFMKIVPKCEYLPTEQIDFVKEWIDKIYLARTLDDAIFVDYYSGEIIDTYENAEKMTLDDLKILAREYKFHSFKQGCVGCKNNYVFFYCVKR